MSNSIFKLSFTLFVIAALSAGAVTQGPAAAQSKIQVHSKSKIARPTNLNTHKTGAITHRFLDFDGDGITDYAVLRDSGVPRPSSPDPATSTSDIAKMDFGRQIRTVPGVGHGYYFKLRGERFNSLAPHMSRTQNLVVDQLLWVINTSGPTADLSLMFGTLNDFPVPADYDGDGITDLAVWTGGPGAQFRVLTSGSGFVTEVDYLLGDSASDPSIVGDFDGDGLADPAVFDANTGQWSYLGGSAHDVPVTVTPIGAVGGVFPIPGDYDGDGKCDFMFETRDGLNQSAGHFYLALNDGTTTPPETTNFVFGNYSDVVVPGDYDGDGSTDIALASVAVNPIAWRVRRSIDGSLLGPFDCGDPDLDYTITGDYDGNLQGEIAIWHGPGEFYSLMAPVYDAPSTEFVWGQDGDYPVAYFNVH